MRICWPKMRLMLAILKWGVCVGGYDENQNSRQCDAATVMADGKVSLGGEFANLWHVFMALKVLKNIDGLHALASTLAKTQHSGERHCQGRGLPLPKGVRLLGRGLVQPWFGEIRRHPRACGGG